MDLLMIKKHLNIDHDLDDALINAYSLAAESAVAAYINNPYNEENQLHEMSKLLIIGSFYSARENEVIGATVAEMPLGIKFMLDMEKRMPL